VAERISVGEMDAEIKIKSRDEIGDLAEAISRMQESIRLSIERLRRRR
jgi:HAMP domain-containing protein